MASKHGGLVLGADQAHTIGILAALNKLKGIEDLTNNNFISWQKQVIGQLSTIHLDPYLSDVSYKNIDVGPEINDVRLRDAKR
ncbi:hypothetical protein PSTG_15290, partial [Puccinia striiformis f. sp. tritici PST-78]